MPSPSTEVTTDQEVSNRHPGQLPVLDENGAAIPEPGPGSCEIIPGQVVSATSKKGARLANDLSLLICGKPTAAPYGDSELGQILTHIQESMDYLMDEISWLGEQEPRRVSMLGPFLGRSLLELSATALIGRLDPLRILVVRQIQAQPEYDTAIPWKASIRWQGDVLAAKKVTNLWGEALDYEKVTKALLGDYYDHLVWRPAALRMLGFATAGGAWLAEIATRGAESFVSQRREDIGGLYSSLSKGIHHEFVMPPGAIYDRATVTALILRTVHLVADLGLVSHFVAHATCSLSADEALAAFNQIETVEVMK